MSNLKEKNRTSERRRLRNRAKIFGTSAKPRLSVFRSNKYTYVQLIDDNAGKTLASASTFELASAKGGSASGGKNKGNPSAGSGQRKADHAKALGVLMAEKAKKVNIKEVVFNKGPYLYHGRIQAVADGAREGGLKI